MNHKINDVVYKEVAVRMGVDEEEVRQIHTAMWKFIRGKITEIDFQAIQTEEEFNKLKVCFMLPNLGRLYATYKHSQIINKYRTNEYKKGDPLIYQSCNNNG